MRYKLWITVEQHAETHEERRELRERDGNADRHFLPGCQILAGEYTQENQAKAAALELGGPKEGGADGS